MKLDAFIAGFVKEAQGLGLTEDEIGKFWGVSMGQPEVSQFIKKMSNDKEDLDIDIIDKLAQIKQSISEGKNLETLKKLCE